MGSNNRLHEIEFGRDVLKLVLEALFLDKCYGTISFVGLRLEGFSHAKTWPHELYSQVNVRCGDLDLFPLEVKM